jgi:hypothetical protein
MVKRTVVVLGILALTLIAAGASQAQVALPFSPLNECFGSEFMPRPMFLPVDCPDPIRRTITSTWECKIEGPCPPVTPAGCGDGGMFGRDDRAGMLTYFVRGMASPFDMLFGSMDPNAVYGCNEMAASPCGSSMGGPIPRIFTSMAYLWYPTDGSFFGGLW